MEDYGITYREELLEMMNLTLEENEQFMRTAYLRVFLNSFPQDYTEIITSTSKAIIYGIAATLSVFLIGTVLNLPNTFTFIGIAKFELYLYLVMVSIFLFWAYIYNGIWPILKLNKLEKRRDDIREAYDIDSLEEAF